MSSEIATKGLIPAQVPRPENGTLRTCPSLFARAFSTVFQTGELSSSSLGSQFQRSEVKVKVQARSSPGLPTLSGVHVCTVTCASPCVFSMSQHPPAMRTPDALN